MFLRTKNRVIYVFTISYKLERFFFERPDHFEHFLVMNTIIQGITAIGVNLTWKIQSYFQPVLKRDPLCILGRHLVYSLN